MKVTKHVVTKEKVDVEIKAIRLPHVDEIKKVEDSLKYYKGTYWSGDPGRYPHNAIGFYRDGTPNDIGHVVNNSNVFVRPILEVSGLVKGDVFEFGKYKWTMISDTTALCNTDFGLKTFRDYHIPENEEDWHEYFSHKFNNYEESTIKEYLDEWLRKNER